jgi:hypothetical protein
LANTFPYRSLAFICEECSDPDEAQRLADWYQRIIGEIERQVNDGGRF